MTQHQPCHRGVGTQGRPPGGKAAPAAEASAVERGEGKVTEVEPALNELDGEPAAGAAVPEQEVLGPGRETARSWGRGEAPVPSSPAP